MNIINIVKERMITEEQYLFLIERAVELNTNLNDYEVRLVETLINNTSLDVDNIIDEIRSSLNKVLSKERISVLLNELDLIFATVNNKIESSIRESIPEVFLKCTQYHADTLTLFGSLPIKSTVTSATLETILGNEILGYPFTSWVASIYQKPIDNYLRLVITENLDKSYPVILKELRNNLTGISQFNLVSLVRTFVQGANVSAMRSVYRENPEYLEDGKVIWSSVLENGYKNTGRGTCLRCAGLDGNEYELDKHPPIPLHPRCRCTLLPKAKSWKDLGLRQSDIDDKLRAYSLRENKNIDAGGTRKLLEAGQISSNDYGIWLLKQSKKIQIETLGIKRYELLKNKKIIFDDLVDPDNGELRTLKDLEN